MYKGDEVHIEIQSVNKDGLATSQLGNSQLLVTGAGVGDRLQVVVDHVSRHTGATWCTIRSVVHRGPQYTMPPCENAATATGSCGGCPMMHLTPGAQDEAKFAAATETLASVIGTAEISWHPSADRLGYRNRGNFVYDRNPAGKPVLGSYVPRGHTVATMAGCLIVRPIIREVHRYLCAALARIAIPVFPSPDCLRYVTVRATEDGRALVNFTVDRDSPPWLPALLETTMDHPAVLGVSLSENPGDTNAIRVCEARQLSGLPTITETVGDIQLELGADTFSQLNSQVAGRMYQRAAQEIRDGQVIWDLYCGTGGLGLTCAAGKSGVQLMGADAVSSSVALAQKNAARMKVAAGYAVMDLTQGVATDWQRPNVVIVNPPRRGLDRSVLQTLSTGAQPEKIIYMSCNPVSFARDAQELAEAGYRLLTVQAHDMLPQTTHVELLGILTR